MIEMSWDQDLDDRRSDMAAKLLEWLAASTATDAEFYDSFLARVYARMFGAAHGLNTLLKYPEVFAAFLARFPAAFARPELRLLEYVVEDFRSAQDAAARHMLREARRDVALDDDSGDTDELKVFVAALAHVCARMPRATFYRATLAARESASLLSRLYAKNKPHAIAELFARVPPTFAELVSEICGRLDYCAPLKHSETLTPVDASAQMHATAVAFARCSLGDDRSPSVAMAASAALLRELPKAAAASVGADSGASEALCRRLYMSVGCFFGPVAAEFVAAIETLPAALHAPARAGLAEGQTARQARARATTNMGARDYSPALASND